MKVTIHNRKLSAQASAVTQSNNKRLRNWYSAIAKDYPVELGRYVNDHFYYKGSFKGWKGYHYYPIYTSYFEIENWDDENVLNRTCKYVYGFKDQGIKEIKLNLPKNWEWHIDALGVYAMPPDGTDWHLSVEDVLRRDFVTNLKRQVSQKRVKEKELERIKAQERKFNNIFEREKENCFVLLSDSLRAGNCKAGSLAFAQRLGINTDAIESAEWLNPVPSRILIRTKNQNAENAVRMAFTRETTISI